MNDDPATIAPRIPTPMPENQNPRCFVNTAIEHNTNANSIPK